MTATGNGRRAFTLVELLVVIAILLLLLALLLPAVQKAREAAQRTGCMNNLHNLGVGLHNYETSHRELPPGGVDLEENGNWNGAHGWVVFLLPHIEQNALYNRYQWDSHWNYSVNQPVVTNHLKLMQCPSALPDRMDEGYKGAWQAAAGDYGVLHGIHPKLRKDGLIEWVANLDGVMWVVGFKHSSCPKLADVADGTSNTIVIAEDAGRPDVWRREGLVSNKSTTGAGWADRDNAFELTGYSSDGKDPYGECAVNCTNANEVFSFHPGGANLLFADGSVRFAKAEISIRVMAALITRAGGETIPAGEF